MAIPFRLCLHRHQCPLPSTQRASHHLAQCLLFKRRVIEDVVESSDHRFRGILELSIMQNGLCSSIKHDLCKIEMRFPLQDFLNKQSNLLVYGHTLPTMPPQTSLSFAFDTACISSFVADFCKEAFAWRCCWKQRPQMLSLFWSIRLTVCALLSNTTCARLRCAYPYKIAWRIKPII